MNRLNMLLLGWDYPFYTCCSSRKFKLTIKVVIHIWMKFQWGMRPAFLNYSSPKTSHSLHTTRLDYQTAYPNIHILFWVWYQHIRDLRKYFLMDLDLKRWRQLSIGMLVCTCTNTMHIWEFAMDILTDRKIFNGIDWMKYALEYTSEINQC